MSSQTRGVRGIKKISVAVVTLACFVFTQAVSYGFVREVPIFLESEQMETAVEPEEALPPPTLHTLKTSTDFLANDFPLLEVEVTEDAETSKVYDITTDAWETTDNISQPSDQNTSSITKADGSETVTTKTASENLLDAVTGSYRFTATRTTETQNEGGFEEESEDLTIFSNKRYKEIVILYSAIKNFEYYVLGIEMSDDALEGSIIALKDIQENKGQHQDEYWEVLADQAGVTLALLKGKLKFVLKNIYDRGLQSQSPTVLDVVVALSAYVDELEQQQTWLSAFKQQLAASHSASDGDDEDEAIFEGMKRWTPAEEISEDRLGRVSINNVDISTDLFGYQSEALVAQVVGEAIEVSGEVEVKRSNDDGEWDVLSMSAAHLPILMGDEIITGDSGHVRLQFRDETTFTIGPMSKFILNEYVYDPTTHKGKMLVTVVKGVFRFVSGRIPKNNPDENFQVDLPIGYIGVRGTTVIGEVSATQSLVVLEWPYLEKIWHGHMIVGNDVRGEKKELHITTFGQATIVKENQAPSEPFQISQEKLNSLREALS